MTGVGEAIETARRALLDGCSAGELARHLYSTWYAAAVHEPAPPADLPDDLVAVFRAVHAGSEAWESGWTAREVGSAGQVVARRADEVRVLQRCDYVVPNRPGVVASPGAAVLVPSRRDHADTDAGWWYTHSPGWVLDAPDGDLFRLYWNADSGEAASVVAALSGVMATADVPWLLKCAVDREAYARADAIVLYLRRESAAGLRRAIDEIRMGLAPALRDATPPLTFRVGRGLGVCDDPGNGESFGEHRCRLVAEGVLAAASEGQLAQAVAARFREEGVPLDRPYVATKVRRLPWE